MFKGTLFNPKRMPLNLYLGKKRNIFFLKMCWILTIFLIVSICGMNHYWKQPIFSHKEISFIQNQTQFKRALSCESDMDEWRTDILHTIKSLMYYVPCKRSNFFSKIKIWFFSLFRFTKIKIKTLNYPISGSLKSSDIMDICFPSCPVVLFGIMYICRLYIWTSWSGPDKNVQTVLKNLKNLKNGPV